MPPDIDAILEAEPMTKPVRSPATREGRDQSVKTSEIPTTFVPQFIENLDGRLQLTREIKARLEALQNDSGVDSYAKRVLAKRAIWVELQLESAEARAAEGEDFDAGRYTQMLNTLIGLLKTLGVEPVKRNVVATVQSYAAEKYGKKTKRSKKRRGAAA